MAHFNFVISQNGGMPVFTLIATGWRHRNMRTGKYCFTKKHCMQVPSTKTKEKISWS